MFNPREFINVSRDFSVSGLTEAQYRTAISRALYGIFLWAREELASRGEAVKITAKDYKGEEHSRVRQRFKQGPFRHGLVSQRLGGLYRMREKSDYEVDNTVTQADVQQTLAYVDYIEGVFDTPQFFSKPPKSS